MKKSRSQEARELPLFDLPLQGDLDDASAGGEFEARTGTLVETAARPRRPADVRRPVPIERDGRDELKLDADEEAAATTAAVERGGRSEVPLSERFLAGLADFALQATALGVSASSLVVFGIEPSLGLWPAFAVLTLVFSFLYWVVPLAFWGQTPGMTWQGHLARSRHDDALTFGQTTRRWLGALVTAGLAGLPLVLALGGGRSLSDRLSETKTVRVHREP